MATCYASSWEAGEKGHFQHLLTFVSEIERSTYIARYPADGGGITEILPVERALFMRSLKPRFKMMLVILNPVTDQFEQH